MKMANYLRSLIKPEIEEYKEICNFNREECEVIDRLSIGDSWVKIEMEMKISEGTLYKIVKEIKRKMEKKDKRENNVPVWQKMNLTLKEAAEYSNIGINKLQSLVKDPTCPFVLYVGTKKLIKRTEFEKFIEKQIEI